LSGAITRLFVSDAHLNLRKSRSSRNSGSRAPVDLSGDQKTA
jgi:hypothetical protein